MTVTYLAPALRLKSWTSNGQPNAFGTVATYAAGTNTPAATYVDSTGTTQNLNPIALNNRGEASVFILPNVAIKFIEFDQLGNQIGVVDQVVNSQLVTYYGVDTGAANAYILTAATPYTTYTNGQLVFFVPGNTNTGPSTINLNGFGVIPIVTITGAALGAGQIQAGIMAEMIYFNGSFQLLSIGSFSGVTVGTIGQEVPIASAATVDLGTAPAHTVQITGTTTITSLGSSASISAPYYFLRFSGILTLTYNATSLTLPGNASIVTSPGDSAIAQYLGNGLWRVAFYQYASGSNSNAKIKPADTAIVSNATLTADPDLYSNQLAIGRYAWEALLIFDSVAGGAGFKWTNGGTAIDSRGLAPALGMGFINAAAYGPKAETPYATTITYATVGTGANSNEVLYKGSLLVNTVGTFGINWAQAASTASSTTLRAGSYLTLTQLNTGTSANTITRVYQTPGSFLETVPSGYTTLTLEVWGAGGGGGGGLNNAPNGVGGGGGGSGGYGRTAFSVLGLGGSTVNFTVGSGGIPAGVGGTSTASAGTLAIATITCVGGTQGASAPPAGAGGAGGTAAGGTVVNTSGNTGGGGQTNPAGGAGGSGGFGIPGINGGGNAGGAGGFLGHLSGFSGGVGIVIFSYS